MPDFDDNENSGIFKRSFQESFSSGITSEAKLKMDRLEQKEGFQENSSTSMASVTLGAEGLTQNEKTIKNISRNPKVVSQGSDEIQNMEISFSLRETETERPEATSHENSAELIEDSPKKR